MGPIRAGFSSRIRVYVFIFSLVRPPQSPFIVAAPFFPFSVGTREGCLHAYKAVGARSGKNMAVIVLARKSACLLKTAEKEEKEKKTRKEKGQTNGLKRDRMAMIPKSFGVPRSSLPSCSPSPTRDFFFVYFFARLPSVVLSHSFAPSSFVGRPSFYPGPTVIAHALRPTHASG